jgi:broad specificity phosphatase PhoE
MNNPTSLYFVRHGEVHNPQNIFYGRKDDFRLSKKGQHQAQAVADLLGDKPLAAIFSSPLLRTMQTAEIIRTRHDNLTIESSELLNEVYSPFDGHPLSELIARNWDVYTGVAPDYEQPTDILSRAQRFITDVRQRYSGQYIVAVTHRDVIVFLTLWLNDIPVTANIKQGINRLGLPKDYPTPGSIVRLVYQTLETDELPNLVLSPVMSYLNNPIIIVPPVSSNQEG